MIKFIKRNKVFSLLILLTMISIISGFLFYAKLDGDSKEIVSQNIQTILQGKNNNMLTYITNQILSTSTIWILGISIIGLPIILGIYLYLVFIFSFELCALIANLGFKSIICILIYMIPKFIMILTIFILCYYSIHFSIYLFKYLFLHQNLSFPKIMQRYNKIYLYTVIGLIISSILEYINMYHLIKIFY